MDSVALTGIAFRWQLVMIRKTSIIEIEEVLSRYGGRDTIREWRDGRHGIQVSVSTRVDVPRSKEETRDPSSSIDQVLVG